MDIFSIDCEATAAAQRARLHRSASYAGAALGLHEGPALHHAVTSPPAIGNPSNLNKNHCQRASSDGTLCDDDEGKPHSEREKPPGEPDMWK